MDIYCLSSKVTFHTDPRKRCSLYTDHPYAIGVVYIVFSALALAVNLLVIFLVCKSTRMRRTPKYWLVLCISFLFIFQATVPNSFLATRWIYHDTPFPCSAWSMTIVYSQYLGVGLVTFVTFLVNFDFLMCVIFSSYTRYYRAKVLLFLLVVTASLLTAIVLALAIVYAKQSSGTSSFHCSYQLSNEEVHEGLIWITLYTPIILSISSCCLTSVCRMSRRVQNIIGVNRDISDSLDLEPCHRLPPLDHVIFVLLISILFLPNDSLLYRYTSCTQSQCPTLFHFVTASYIMSDCAGCAAPLAWFFFNDMRAAFIRLMHRRGGNSGPSDFIESSEMRIFDSYPYCTGLNT